MRLIICWVVFVCLMTCSPALKAEEANPSDWTVKVSGGAQFTASTYDTNFVLPYARAYLEVKNRDRVRFFLELDGVRAPYVAKAYLDCKLIGSYLVLRAGQQANYIKFIDLPPEISWFNRFVYDSYYLENFESFGYVFHGQLPRLTYYVGLENGPDRTYKDNNAAKDFVGLLTFKPVKFLTLEGAWQNGRQPGSYRRLHYEKVIVDFGPLSLAGSYFNRGDWHQEGWAAQAAFKVCPRLKLVGQACRKSQLTTAKTTGEPEYTFGAILVDPKNRLEFRPNVTFGEGRRSEVILLLQYWVK